MHPGCDASGAGAAADLAGHLAPDGLVGEGGAAPPAIGSLARAAARNGSPPCDSASSQVWLKIGRPLPTQLERGRRSARRVVRACCAGRRVHRHRPSTCGCPDDGPHACPAEDRPGPDHVRLLRMDAADVALPDGAVDAGYAPLPFIDVVPDPLRVAPRDGRGVCGGGAHRVPQPLPAAGAADRAANRDRGSCLRAGDVGGWMAGRGIGRRVNSPNTFDAESSPTVLPGRRVAEAGGRECCAGGSGPAARRTCLGAAGASGAIRRGGRGSAGCRRSTGGGAGPGHPDQELQAKATSTG